MTERQPEAGTGPRVDPVQADAGAPTTTGAMAPDGGVAEVEQRLLRAVADLESMRERYDRQLVRERIAERARVAAALLPVLDGVEHALERPRGDADALADEVRAVRDRAVVLLAELGYPRHDETGVPFQPAVHEAVVVLPGTDTDAPPGTVLQVVRPGYGDGEWQLRPAAVVVAGDPG
ncbi:nucleotide exchange factor GrpE [Micromonospora sp. NPDC049679]|uniref:nucleotide exchange factor GrpE n=1 Tax=Micromonospora sp. NPDC049679 TaxID=3155920 RepID=UPI00340E1396